MLVTLPNVRLHFPWLYEKSPDDGEYKPTYNGTFTFPKSNKRLKKELDAAIKKVAEEKWDEKAEKILERLKKDDRVCLRCGDEKIEKADKPEKYEMFEDTWYLKASDGDVQPKIRDVHGNPLEKESGKPYGGCYVYAFIDIWAQDHPKYGKRINAKLRAVQFYKDGPAFGGGAPMSDDEFTDLAEDIDDEDDGEAIA